MSLRDRIKGKSQKEALDIISKAVADRGMSPYISKLLDEVLGTAVEKPVDSESESKAFRAMRERVNDDE